LDKTILLAKAQTDRRMDSVLDWDEVLNGLRTGMVFLTIEGTPIDGVPGKRAASQCLVQLTDLGVEWKKDATGLYVNVFSMASGAGVGGAFVQLLDGANELLSGGRCDATGAGFLKVPSQPRWLRVEHGNDVHLLSMGPVAQELSMRSFRIATGYSPWSGEAQAMPLRSVLFTDRPLYRRGETVHVHGIVRGWGRAGNLSGASIRLSMAVSGGAPAKQWEIPVQTDDMGAFSCDVPLPASATGLFGLRLKREGDPEEATGEVGSALFQVADFQPEAFEVQVQAPARVSEQTPFRAGLEAKYLSGGALSRARVKWTVHMRSLVFSPPGFEDFTFEDPGAPALKQVVLSGTASIGEGGGTGQVGTASQSGGTGVSAGAGSVEIAPALPDWKDVPAQGMLSVEVTDLNQQTVSRRTAFARDVSSLYIGLQRLEEVVVRAGEAVRVRSVAVAPEGTPAAAPVRVRYELVELRHEVVRVQGAGKAVSFKTETSEEVLETREAETELPKSAAGRWSLADSGGVAFAPEKPGQYRIRARIEDGQGRTARSAVEFTVVGKEGVAWPYKNTAQLELVPGKSEYTPGEKARIALKTPISGRAWVSVERGNHVLRRFTTRVEGNSFELEVPVEAADSPRVVVRVVVVRGTEASTRRFKTPEFRYGACEIAVEDATQRIRVEVAPSRPRVMPGEPFESVVRVVDHEGAPVPGARVTFYAVDDGILALRGFTRPDPTKVFAAVPPLKVRAGITLPALLAEDPSELVLANKGYLIGGGGAGDGAVRLRNQFPGTIAWMPDLRTDASGCVRVPLTAPDALTRYRLVAVVEAGLNRFGSAEAAVEIHKPFSLLSAMGPFARIGDTLIARVVARNNAAQAGRARVKLALDGSAQAEHGTRLEQQVELQPGESREIDFPVIFTKRGNARWVASGSIVAGGTGFSDALEIPVTVESPAPVLREVYLRRFSAGANDLLQGVNPQVVEGTGSVDVTLSNTRLAALREGADWLLRYPYGCAEQRISALVPWVMLRDLKGILPGLSADPAEAAKTVEAGFSKLLAQQRSDGGIAYWAGERASNFFVSTYALWALGAVFDEQQASANKSRLVDYLRGELRKRMGVSRGVSVEECAFAVSALAGAGHPEHGYQERLWERRSELSAEARAFLAFALLSSGGSASDAAALLRLRDASGAAVAPFWSTTRMHAARLLAVSLLEEQGIRKQPGANPEGEVWVREMLEAQRQGRWQTTQENAWAILALGGYFKRVEKSLPELEAVLQRAGGAEPRREVVPLDSATMARTFREPFSQSNPLGALSVFNPSGGRLYGEMRFEVQPVVELQPAQARGFVVSRSYRGESSNGRWEGTGDWRVGDRVLVDVVVESETPGFWVAIEDPSPAVLEPVNPYFRAEGSGGALWRIASTAISHREVQADRVVFYCDQLPAGRHHFQYVSRVRMAGKAIAPQAKAEEMYHPERFGLSASERVEASR
jgi:uncharacterized protein YfaS (alpha-2-macroglobulin family)